MYFLQLSEEDKCIINLNNSKIPSKIILFHCYLSIFMYIRSKGHLNFESLTNLEVIVPSRHIPLIHQNLVEIRLLETKFQCCTIKVMCPLGYYVWIIHTYFTICLYILYKKCTLLIIPKTLCTNKEDPR